MIISDLIKNISQKADFVYWTATVGENNISEITRVSGFVIEDDGEHITFFIPKGLFKIIKPTLNPNANISLLMASIMDFESYQVKGFYKSHHACTKENIDFYRPKVLKIIEIMNGMGMNGKGVVGYLLEQPSVAITFHCTETYEQTPKPRTGNKLKV